MALSHPAIASSSGYVRPGVRHGGDGQGLRLACDVPTGGQITVLVDFYVSTL